MIRPYSAFVLLVASALLGACGSEATAPASPSPALAQPPPTPAATVASVTQPTPAATVATTPTAAPKPAGLAEAEQRWKDQGPPNYTITTVATRLGRIQPNVCTTTLKFRSGAMEVSAHDPCPWWEPAESTVPSLFNRIKNGGLPVPVPGVTLDQNCLSVDYDPMYGHPTSIQFDCPKIMDDGMTIDIRLTVD